MYQNKTDNKEIIEEIEKIVDYEIAYEKSREIIKVFEKKIERNHLRFQTIFQESQFGNKILTPDLNIIDVNKAFISMLGYKDKEDLVNRKILDFAHPDYVAHWKKLQKALWQESIPSFSFETKLIKKDLSSIWCQVTSITFEDGGGNLGYTMVENINDRKILKENSERLYKNQEMVMYMVAHDLKSPLINIKSLSDIIRTNIQDSEKDEAFFHLSLLEKSISTSTGIINDLLLIGELESGLSKKVKVNLVDALEKTITEVSIFAKSKSIQIKQDIHERVLNNYVDEGKISRVFQNLLSNAIKFSNPGGEIHTSVKKEGDSILIQINDQGIGIPKGIQPTIFNKFTRDKRKGTFGENTTGLGLYTSKRIVELHGGEIGFESQQDIGTSFYIRLPLNQEQ